MNSNDRTIPVWTSNADKKNHWVEIGLDPNKQIRSINVYWHDNNKSVKIPAKWSMEYLKDNTWEKFEIYVTDSYGTQKDQYNVVHPGDELKCDAIRINITPDSGFAVGILDVDVQYQTIQL